MSHDKKTLDDTLQDMAEWFNVFFIKPIADSMNQLVLSFNQSELPRLLNEIMIESRRYHKRLIRHYTYACLKNGPYWKRVNYK